MSRAKQLIEMMCPAPAVEPKPGVKPAAPGRTAPPRPAQPSRPNPFRRREIRPGEAPRPKAMMPTGGMGSGGPYESLTEAQKKGKLKQPPEGKAPEKAYSKAKAAITTKTSVPGKGDLKKPADGAQPAKAFKKGS